MSGPAALPWRVKLATTWDSALPIILINGAVGGLTWASLSPSELAMDQPWKILVVGAAIASSLLAAGALVMLAGVALVRRVLT